MNEKRNIKYSGMPPTFIMGYTIPVNSDDIAPDSAATVWGTDGGEDMKTEEMIQTIAEHLGWNKHTRHIVTFDIDGKSQEHFLYTNDMHAGDLYLFIGCAGAEFAKPEHGGWLIQKSVKWQGDFNKTEKYNMKRVVFVVPVSEIAGGKARGPYDPTNAREIADADLLAMCDIAQRGG